MIDLHSHILPNIDDGAADMPTALSMARMAVSDGTTHIACTPHIVPGVYNNTPGEILRAIAELKLALAEANINLNLVSGADVHLRPDIVDKLTKEELPRINNSRYFLFEPPHHVLPPKIIPLAKEIIGKGYVPILTHPERLTWIENHYDTICELDELGVAIQLTAMSVTGNFGKRALYWSNRMLEEGRVDIIASDAHNTRSRPPGLARARDVIVDKLGSEEAQKMVKGNPNRILKNLPLAEKLPRKSVRQPKRLRDYFMKF